MNEYTFLFNRVIIYIDNKGLSLTIQLTPYAATLAAADGPFPFGDTLAVTVLAAAAVRDAVTPGPGTGNCARAVHRILQNNVEAAKTAAGLLGGCKEKDCCWLLKVKKGAWFALASARRMINRRCFDGGDSGHSQAENDAWLNFSNCLRMIQSSCK